MNESTNDYDEYYLAKCRSLDIESASNSFESGLLSYVYPCYKSRLIDKMDLEAVLLKIKTLMADDVKIKDAIKFNVPSLMLDSDEDVLQKFSFELIKVLEDEGEADSGLILLKGIYVVYLQANTIEGFLYIENSIEGTNPIPYLLLKNYYRICNDKNYSSYEFYESSSVSDDDLKGYFLKYKIDVDDFECLK